MEKDALEEGRIALILLEKQLNERRENFNSDLSIGSETRHSSLNHERRILDKVPRDARLHNRRGSPLGLTVEELDDRGLLDGGGSSRSATLKQKNRRPLEMRKRSSRLQERDQESWVKISNRLFHMLRTLAKRGVQIEELCREKDQDDKGLVSRADMFGVIRGLGLPMVKKDIIDVLQRYVMPSTNEIDYNSFLRDSGVQSVERIKDGVSGAMTIQTLSDVVIEVKRMLLEIVRSLNKSYDDIYAMFACWDHEGVGTVTATQFLRVLNRLHIEQSDSDQDFLIEVLDTDLMGRIDFGSLLNFCFGDVMPNSLVTAVAGSQGLTGGDDRSESASAITSESAKLSSDVNLSTRRPRTATLTPSSSDAQQRDGAAFNEFGGNARGVGGGGVGGAGRVRPTTASARVSASDRHSHADMRHSGDQRQQQLVLDRDEDVILEFSDDVIDDHDHHQYNAIDPASSYGMGGLNRGPSNLSGTGVGGSRSDFYDYPTSSNRIDLMEVQDMGSLNDTTLITDQDEYNFGSPLSPQAGKQDFNDMTYQPSGGGGGGGGGGQYFPPVTGNRRGLDSGVSGGGTGSGILGQIVSGNGDKSGRIQGGLFQSSTATSNRKFMDSSSAGAGGGGGGGGGGVGDRPVNFSTSSGQRQAGADANTNSPKTVLMRMREYFLAEYNTGKKWDELFHVLDVDRKGFIDAEDLVQFGGVIRTDIDEDLSCRCVSQLALDGRDKVSLGEFKVFLFDPDHRSLERSFQDQLAHQLERHGRQYQNILNSCFWDVELKRVLARNGTTGVADERALQRQIAQSGFVSESSFREGLLQLGLKLTNVEINRIVSRFDASGKGQCSVSRFLSCVQSCTAWKNAERILAYQEEALEEGAALRQQQQRDGSQTSPELSEELLSMAEYLGIRPISEGHLLWIAVDALRAPLPVSWSAQKDSQGRTFFYNHISNQSRWDHPLDSHFRKLRDEYRQSDQFSSMKSNKVQSQTQQSQAPTQQQQQQPSMNRHHQSKPPTPSPLISFPASRQSPSPATSAGPDHFALKSSPSDYFESSGGNDRAASHHQIPSAYYSTAVERSLPQMNGPGARPASAPIDLTQRDAILYGEMRKKPSVDEIYRPLSSSNAASQQQQQQQKKAMPKGIMGSSQVGSIGSRPQSAARLKPSAVPSIVDKAMSFGINRRFMAHNPHEHVGRNDKVKEKFGHDFSYTPPTKGEISRIAHLTEMFDDHLLDKLDCIIVPKTNSAQGQKKLKGGIVLL